MSLSSAIDQLQTLAAAIGDVKYAPVGEWPEQGVFPFAITYPDTGTFFNIQAGFNEGLHTVITEFHVERTMLTHAITTSITILEVFLAALVADPTLSGTVSTIRVDAETPIRYTFGEMKYDGTPTVGVQVQITLKIH